jgi:hypothetical protein
LDAVNITYVSEIAGPQDASVGVTVTTVGVSDIYGPAATVEVIVMQTVPRI